MKQISHSSRQELFKAEPQGEAPKNIGTSFYRGENCNFNPYATDYGVEDFCRRFVLKGWEPKERLIGQNTKVTAFGSCFAHNISEHLSSLGFNMSKDRNSDIYVSTMGEGLVNVHSILQQFKWALDNWTPPSNLWHGYKAEEHDIKEEVRIATRDVFLNTDIFVLTFGLSEIWYDEVTGGVFWRAVPLRNFDESRHKFRVCSFAETKESIEEIIRLIQTHVPNAKIVMTVSPIPLVATFRPHSCITANSASKAIIRAAMDEIMREKESEVGERLFYFPAYDIVTECFPNRYVNDGRHLQLMIVPAIMRIFEALYCQTEMTIEAAEAGLREARLLDTRALREHPFYGKGF